MGDEAERTKDEAIKSNSFIQVCSLNVLRWAARSFSRWINDVLWKFKMTMVHYGCGYYYYHHHYQLLLLRPLSLLHILPPLLPSYYHHCRDTSVGIAARLDGPGIESWCKRDLPHLSRPALKPTQTPIQWIPGLFSGGKTAEAWP